MSQIVDFEGLEGSPRRFLAGLKGTLEKTYSR
jgi:hypothetical protein